MQSLQELSNKTNQSGQWALGRLLWSEIELWMKMIFGPNFILIQISSVINGGYFMANENEIWSC